MSGILSTLIGLRFACVCNDSNHSSVCCNRVPSWCDRSLDRSFIELVLIPATAPRLVNKGGGMCYPVCGMMHIKELLLLIGKSSPCGSCGFPLSLSELLWKEGNVLFNNTLNTFYLRLYGVRHMVNRVVIYHIAVNKMC